MKNPWLGRSQKITFHRQLRKMLTTGAGEKKDIGDVNKNFIKSEVFPVPDSEKTTYE